MDDLDRMFRRLVQNIRNGYPDYLTRPFEVAELYRHLVPYRHNRREMEIDTNQDYELALCRLLSGERGYLAVDDALGEAMRQELAASNPNTAIFREFAASRVSLGSNAERRADQLMSAPDRALAPTLATPATPPASPSALTPGWLGRAPAASGAAGSTAPPVPMGAAGTPAGARSGGQSAGEDACRYCGGSLPPGRSAMFCPHCGQNLTVQRCPACGTELEIDWKYCITCGRGVAGS